MKKYRLIVQLPAGLLFVYNGDMADFYAFRKQMGEKIRLNEPLSEHTTFRIGGFAEIWAAPDLEGGLELLAVLLDFAREEGRRVCVLGRGANILFSDAGFAGLVIDMRGFAGLAGFDKDAGRVSFWAGTAVDSAVEELAGNSFGRAVSEREKADLMGILDEIGAGGLEFLAGLPATIGGAVYMNARCYEKSVSDALISVDILDERRNLAHIPFRGEEWGYKRSPFQGRDCLIVRAEFAVKPFSGENEAAEREKSRAERRAHRVDRAEKGHYRFPSAGSVFKNNRDFGKPTGKIIDELGLCGESCGGAMVAPFHGNIIINTGGAASADVRLLIERVAGKVREKLGFTLEPEIIFL